MGEIWNRGFETYPKTQLQYLRGRGHRTYWQQYEVAVVMFWGVFPWGSSVWNSKQAIKKSL